MTKGLSNLLTSGSLIHQENDEFITGRFVINDVASTVKMIFNDVKE